MTTNENQVSKVFRVRDENLAMFEDAMGRLARRAKRLGCDAPSYVKGEPLDEPEWKKDEFGLRVKTGRVFRFWPVTVSGNAPKFNGWTFVATLEHLATDDGQLATMLRRVPCASEIAIPESYRTAGPDCAHCNQQRRRADTYLLAHDSGEMKQVGSSCIRDFLGHDSPETLATMAEWLRDAFEAGEEGESFSGGKRHRFTVLHFLGHVSAVMRKLGWTPRSKAMPEFGKSATADIAYSAMLKGSSEYIDGVAKEDEERAALALAWAASLRERGETASDYMYNVNVVARCAVLGDRSTGIAASIIAAYERAMEQERKQAQLTSAHVGTVDERMVLTLTILGIKELDGNYGVTRMHMMTDAEGRRFKWFGSGAGAEIGKVGETVTIKATIKAHGEYKDVKETVLSRCAVYVEKARKARATKASES